MDDISHIFYTVQQCNIYWAHFDRHDETQNTLYIVRKYLPRIYIIMWIELFSNSFC